MVQPEPGQEPSEPMPAAPPGATMVYKPQGPPTEAATPGQLGVEPEVVTLDANGTKHTIDKASVTIGRSRDCDIRLADPNVSRRHAEVRQEGSAFWILDLGSTNGLTVNGRRQQRAKLENDDRITVGSTELVFRRA
jgi:pSer/pThr/pTyr-binding forkhead associated (FHA) protein